MVWVTGPTQDKYNKQNKYLKRWFQKKKTFISFTSSASLPGAAYDFLGTFGGESGCKTLRKLFKSCCGETALHWLVKLSYRLNWSFACTENDKKNIEIKLNWFVS